MIELADLFIIKKDLVSHHYLILHWVSGMLEDHTKKNGNSYVKWQKLRAIGLAPSNSVDDSLVGFTGKFEVGECVVG